MFQSTNAQSAPKKQHYRKPITLEDMGFFDLQHSAKSGESLIGLSKLRKLELSEPRKIGDHDYFDEMPQFPVVEVGLNYLKLLPSYVMCGGRRKDDTQTTAQKTAQEENKKHLNRGQRNGALLSPHVRRKIKKIGSNWINSMMIAEAFYRHKKRKNLLYKSIPRGSHPVFITLTIPGVQKHGDREIKSKCLDRFLSALRKKFAGDLNYMWVAELQKRGAIHFHILSDRYVHFTQVEALWSRAVGGLDYVSQGNSTQTVSVKAADLPGYLTKYFTADKFNDVKNVNTTGVAFSREVLMLRHVIPGDVPKEETIVLPMIEGRKWGASSDLLKLLNEKILNYCRIYLEDFNEFRRWMFKRVTRKGSAQDILYHNEKCVVLRQPLEHLPQLVKELFYAHYFRIWAQLNKKTAKHVQEHSYVFNKAGNWGNILAGIRKQGVYSFPSWLPELARKPVPVYQGILDL